LRFHEITVVERFGRKSANPSIGETTNPEDPVGSSQAKPATAGGAFDT
jgi:hypothetical protein